MAVAKQIDFLLAGLRHPLTDEPLAGGKVTTYTGGTTTPVNLYIARDTEEGNATNPVILDAYGRAEVFGNGVYKFSITDADDVPIVEFDMVEYVPVVESEVSGGNLDMDGNKIVNLGAGSDPGDAVNYQQLLSTESTLQAGIDAVADDLAAQTFLDLTDTPSSYAGHAGKLAVVNTGATALEFIPKEDVVAAGTFTDLSDTPADYSGQAGKAPIVNGTADALEFGYPDAKTIQGKAVDATEPADGQQLVFDAVEDKYVPTTVASGSLTREVVWTGLATTASFTKAGVKFLTITHVNIGDFVTTVEVESLVEAGYLRFLNRGGENADRNYDYGITVSRVGDTYSFSGSVNIKKISVMY